MAHSPGFSRYSKQQADEARMRQQMQTIQGKLQQASGLNSTIQSKGSQPMATTNSQNPQYYDPNTGTLYSYVPSTTTSGTITFGPYTTSMPPDSGMAKPKAKPKKPSVTFDSVIIPEGDKRSIMDAIAQVENQALIFEKWGFNETLEKGKAISMLFWGEPGTGKTLMAQAIADKLAKKLKIVGSAEIESSEPGGAERAIKAFFEGTKADTILLFDECDSLIYDRSAVGSILAAQVNQLLSSLEKFEGIVIFTTNRLGVLDEAFNRRLSLKMEFKLPDFEQRIEIWKRMFPKKAPIEGIDWKALASIEITGGYIKNTVLRAARMAAAQKGPHSKKKITHNIVVKALDAEIKSMVEFQNAKKNTPGIPRLVSQGGYRKVIGK